MEKVKSPTFNFNRLFSLIQKMSIFKCAAKYRGLRADLDKWQMTYWVTLN